MSVVINLFAGPGAGKSTAATGVFSKLKQAGVSCEYVSECAKDYVWRGKLDVLEDQERLFAEQFERQRILLGQVDYIITDSPLLLGCVYYRYWQKKNNLPDSPYHDFMVEYFRNTFKLFDNQNWIINRNKPYDEKGRTQTLDEAKQIDVDVRAALELTYWYNSSIQWQDTTSKNAIDDIYHSITRDIAKQGT